MECGAIHGVLSKARSLALEQRELLHPAPQHVPESSVHTKKTPNVTGPTTTLER